MTPQRQCNYHGCTAVIPSDAVFPNCEPCRKLMVSNTIRLTLDPFTSHPTMERSQEVIQSTLLYKMTGPEVINFFQHIEEMYLETLKVVKLHKLEVDTPKRIRLTDSEKVTEGRTDDPKVEKEVRKRLQKRDARKDKLKKTFKGMDDATIRDIMGEDMADL